jgi:hypothetical protein
MLSTGSDRRGNNIADTIRSYKSEIMGPREDNILMVDFGPSQHRDSKAAYSCISASLSEPRIYERHSQNSISLKFIPFTVPI